MEQNQHALWLGERAEVGQEAHLEGGEERGRVVAAVDGVPGEKTCDAGEREDAVRRARPRDRHGHRGNARGRAPHAALHRLLVAARLVQEAQLLREEVLHAVGVYLLLERADPVRLERELLPREPQPVERLADARLGVLHVRRAREEAAVRELLGVLVEEEVRPFVRRLKQRSEVQLRHRRVAPARGLSAG